MLKEKIRVCDTCKERLSKQKCDCCNADMCTVCIADIKTLRVNSQTFGTVLYCLNCKKLYNEIARGDTSFFDEDFKKEMSDRMGEYIKGKILIKKL